METRIAVIDIIIEDKESVALVGEIPHQHGDYIIGRVGPPCEKKQVDIISVVTDAPDDIISMLSGRLGNIRGVSARVLHLKTRTVGKT